jgi:hypothetical protein
MYIIYCRIKKFKLTLSIIYIVFIQIIYFEYKNYFLAIGILLLDVRRALQASPMMMTMLNIIYIKKNGIWEIFLFQIIGER